MQSDIRSDAKPGKRKGSLYNNVDAPTLVPEPGGRFRRLRPKFASHLVQESDVTRVPTLPQQQAKSIEQSPIWQYESPNYEVESSLPALSLIISETPTHSSIDAVDTRPTLLVEQASPTQGAPFTSERNGHGAYVPFVGGVQQATVKEARVRETGSLQARAAALALYRSHKLPAKRRSHNLNPLDHVRWWLLHPGRIEFTLWLCGTVLLIGVTCVIFLVTAFSFGWIAPGQQSGMVPQSAANNRQAGAADPVLTLIDHGPFAPGQVIHVHGQGFSAHGRIVFTFDNTQLRLDHIPASEASQQPQVNADNHGEFTFSLTLGAGYTWKAGRHLIVAHDITTNNLAILPIVLVPNVATPVSTTNPGSQVGPTEPIAPTPVITTTPPAQSTPPPPRPTATATPKPTNTPTPTPTVVPTATATPTPAVTPTATKGASMTSSIATLDPPNLSADLINVQDQCSSPFHPCSMITLASHLWMLVLVYMLALILLIIAGVLRSVRHWN